MGILSISTDARYRIDRHRIREAVKRVLKKQGIEDASISIAVVGDRKMRMLNKTYRHQDTTTDVLSFPYAETNGPFVDLPKTSPRMLGDIVISYPQARECARTKAWFVNDAIDMLVEHGTMHLLGYDHDGLGRWKYT